MRIILGITGGIAAYKAADLIRGLQATGHEVRTIMTDNAKKIITPLTIATLSKNPVMNDMWVERSNVEHIDIGEWADAFVVYPATANIIAKFANGIADDLLSTVYLALPERVAKRVFVYPAMNTNMYNHKTTKRNLKQILVDGVKIAPTTVAMLACGYKGEGAVLKPREAVKFFNENVVL